MITLLRGNYNPDGTPIWEQYMVPSNSKKGKGYDVAVHYPSGEVRHVDTDCWKFNHSEEWPRSCRHVRDLRAFLQIEEGEEMCTEATIHAPDAKLPSSPHLSDDGGVVANTRQPAIKVATVGLGTRSEPSSRFESGPSSTPHIHHHMWSRNDGSYGCECGDILPATQPVDSQGRNGGGHIHDWRLSYNPSDTCSVCGKTDERRVRV